MKCHVNTLKPCISIVQKHFSYKHGHSSRTDTIIFGPLFSAGGPAVSPLSVSSSVSLSVCNFSQIFLILCMLLEVNNCQNPTESDFLGKFLFVHIWAKGTNNGPRRGFILFFDKNCNLIFLKIFANERL